MISCNSGFKKFLLLWLVELISSIGGGCAFVVIVSGVMLFLTAMILLLLRSVKELERKD